MTKFLIDKMLKSSKALPPQDAIWLWVIREKKIISQKEIEKLTNLASQNNIFCGGKHE